MMDQFMEKHRTAVLKIVRDLTHEISDTFNIEPQDLDLLVNEFFQLKKKQKCQGKVVSKNNTPCTCMAIENEIYCRRHLYLKNEQSLDERPRCIGIMRQGKRCVHHATHHSEYCKKHLYQSDTNEGLPCVHYTLDDDGNETFVCDQDAIPDEWCCPKHRHHHRLYSQQFKAKSSTAYLEQVRSGERPPIEILSNHLKNT